MAQKRSFTYAKTATETSIRNGILDYLRIRGYVCKRNNSGFVFLTGPGGKKRMINVGEAGWPDIEGMTKAGVWFGVEVKSATGKMSPGQIVTKERIVKSKGIYILARCIQDVMDAGL